MKIDVLISGCGPSGALLANLLGQAGRSVVVLERADQIYDLPRAVHFDAEIMRVFQGLGLAEQMSAISGELPGAEFVTADGTRLLGLDGAETRSRPLGWPQGSFFYQPVFEKTLRDGVTRFANVDVRLGHQVTGIEQDAEGVRVAFRDLGTGEDDAIEARYMVGADGAGSFTRRALGIDFESLAYDREWLVVDVLLEREVELPVLAQQICDPARPATFIPAVGKHRRWEFQLMPGEKAEDLEKPEKIWELLRPWITPEDARIVRACVYEFHGTVAERWREGRVFLMGDAAHQMPPFMGQGMCAGLRDAANLSWKLGLVLDGLASDRLLDSYQSERKPQADDVVDWSISVGKLIDRFAAAQAGNTPDAPDESAQESGYGGGRRMLALGPGMLQSVTDPDSPVGRPLAQPRVRTSDGGEQLLDELLGGGFAILGRENPEPALTDAARAFWKERDTRIVATGSLELLDSWLDELLASALAIVVRPDRYVAGVAHSPAELDALTEELRAAALTAPVAGARKADAHR